jgi:hypothetical protein
MVKTRMIDGVSRPKAAPEISVDDVVVAILDAIRKEKPQVFVPRSVRWSLDIGSRLFPDLTRRMMKRSDNQGWKTANKDVPDA